MLPNNMKKNRNIFSVKIVCLLLLMFPISAMSQLRVDVQRVNKTVVGLYEKFEIIVNLKNAGYTNPFDPEQLDLRAIFTSSSNKQWEIFGFYDNYLNRNQWKIRFSPNEVGDWKYVLQVTDSSGRAQSKEYFFTAISSGHHGWLKVSEKNPHYFTHDDGASFYAIGPYYPWGVSSGGLDLLQASGANFWGYWNIMYGGEGNIVESLSSGLGYYDQPKCGRIDQLISWSEERGLKMMFAIWPHDLLSKSVWVHQWHQNPYKFITTVENFFESEKAWEYQRKLYRYLIARWGYSRALGIWEIVNEVNGTDGWQNGKQNQATMWVKKVHDYLTKHDPFGHPTTASMSGGHFWAEGYARVDIPNVHLYETGWPALYGSNYLRSSLWTYAKVTQQLWDNSSKPSIMGEAGYTNNYGNFPAGSEEYAAMFHNALWASWANGLAAAPVWWDFGSRNLMNDQVMEQMKQFSSVVQNLNYSICSFERAKIQVSDCDAFAMQGDSLIFGWFRAHYGSDLSGNLLKISGVKDTVFNIVYYDPRHGKQIKIHTRPGTNGELPDIVPDSDVPLADMAFVILPAQAGVTPSRIELLASAKSLLNDGKSLLTVTCLILDDQSRFCNRATNRVVFSLDGPGKFIGEPITNAQKGIVVIQIRADSSLGISKIIASSPGLRPDTLKVKITNKITIDDFEGYRSNSSLAASWRVRPGTHAVLYLEKLNRIDGQQSLRMNYSIGKGSPPYAGIMKQLEITNDALHFLHFLMKPDGSNRELAILLFEKGPRYWRFNLKLVGANPQNVMVPFTDFISNDGTTQLVIANLSDISFNVLKGEGDYGEGVLYFDNLAFSTSITTGVSNTSKSNSPTQFLLRQNYPNPFNDSTIIRYFLPEKSHVEVSVFNSRGQLVRKLLDAFQQRGDYTLQWQAEGAGSGLYFYKIQAGKYTGIKKCVLIR